MEQSIFYILAALALIGTLLAVFEKHPVHAILYLVTSLFAVAVIFYLLMAPLVAAFEVILYAGAIMVLFLFVIMMLDLGHPEKGLAPQRYEWLPALVLVSISIAALVIVISRQAASPVPSLQALPLRQIAARLFQEHGLAVELVSMQLLFALVGALYLGKRREPSLPAPEGGRKPEGEDSP
ncbi:NADH-quinone oxidoreductase subunit J [Geobacter sp. SVR]|uniref:NADH-quinone oxidoreductase subunit J family protein n=1 Tax=Geobacter sp. SVR TaxID=2495594 RepID=UPI00143EFC76|nr:NADH-quinone oxidoreductase subunit J [Geobacter sp. SVR]BCS52322.1 NADH dehydrogenase subunit J [Geobacter sp. SVR]GCF85019.1 NADH dehydrogenase subunit J [Geobacter sp. SVR]